MKLKEIREITGGRIIGDSNPEIKGVSGISESKVGDITYFSNKKLLKELIASPASAVLLKEEITDLNKPQIVVDNPLFCFAGLLEHFYVKPPVSMGIMEGSFVADDAETGEDVTIYPSAFVSEGATIGRGTTLYPNVFVGRNSRIGKECILHPGVVILEDVEIGDEVIIHAGSVMGSDGFGYVFEAGKHVKIPQVGGLIIEDDVEIGSNVTIDRGTTGNTVIGSGTRIDNLVQIAHNVRIGKNCIIIAQVGIAGSSDIGDYVTLAGQVGVADHTIIESGSIFGAKSGITGQYKKGIYFGTPFALPHKQFMKSQSLFNRLPEINKKLNDLQEKVDSILKDKAEVRDD